MKILYFFAGTVTGVIGSVIAAELWMHLAEHSVYTRAGVRR